MHIYLFCLWVGFSGLVAMALLGFSHGGGHHAGAGGRGVNGHAAAGGARHGLRLPRGLSKGISSPRVLWLLIMPRLIFSLMLGFGATGSLLGNDMPAVFVAALAILGAWIFELFMVQPLWRFVLRFASAPARLIESAVLEEAEAKCNFDAEGNGLVAVEIDGQIRQLLGRLRDEDRKYGERVRAGDRLTVVAVDALKNSCTVARFNQPNNPI